MIVNIFTHDYYELPLKYLYMIFTDIVTLFSYSFMHYAVIVGVLLAIVSALIGHYMVLRGYSGISDSISHIALLGIAVGLLAGVHQTLIGFVVTLVLSCGLEYLRQKQYVRGETALALFVVLSLSLLTIIKNTYGLSRSLESLLFGSITAITQESVIMACVLTSVAIVFVTARSTQLMSLTFNEELARLSGVRVVLYNYVLIGLVAATVTIGIDILGGLLMTSLMVVPVAASMQFGFGFRGTQITAIIFGVFSVCVGLLISSIVVVPAGAMIALTSIGVFCISGMVRTIYK